ncbi:MAG: hypothetical protein SFU86_22805 [Pirellulaceae bacterium]|nr:hypothetical protein [Pirellulaceae bacterium]
MRQFPSFLWLFFAAALAGAGNARGAEDLTGRLLADARDGVFDQFTLPAAALVACGVKEASDVAAFELELARRLTKIDCRQARRLSPRDGAELLLRELHREILTGRYEESASDPRLALAGGPYNCLSALVMYADLCRLTGIDLEFRAVPGHVYCRLASQAQWRIEPTRRDGLSRELDITGEAPRGISAAELAGRFFYNRGVEQLTRREFAAAVESLRVACLLDERDEDARANLLAGLNNWAIALWRDEQPAAAQRLIEIGLALDPHHPPLKANAELVRRAGQSR